MSAKQINSLKYFSSLRSSCLAHLTNVTCAGMSESTAEEMGKVIADQCSSLSNACVHAFTALNNVTQTCFKAMQKNNCAAFSQSQLGSLVPSLAMTITKDCVSEIQDCSSLSWRFIQASSCGGASKQCLAQSQNFDDISLECAANFENCQGLTTNIAQLPVAYLSSSCLGNLNPKTCEYIPHEQIGSLKETQCSSFDERCFSYVHSDFFNQFAPECVGVWNHDIFGNLTLTQLHHLTSNAMALVKGDKFSYLVKIHGTDVCDALSQLSIVRENAAAEFLLEIIQNQFPSPAYTFKNISFGADATWLQMAWSTNGEQLIETSFREIPPSVFQGVRPNQISAISDKTLSSLSPFQSFNLNCYAIDSLSGEKLRYEKKKNKYNK